MPFRGPQDDVEMGVKRGLTLQQSHISQSGRNATHRYESTSPGTQSAVSSTASTITKAYDSSKSRSTSTGTSPIAPSIQHVSPPLNPSAPGDWAVDHHRNNLVTALHSVKGQEDSFRVSFSEMQRMHIRKIQVKLIKHGVEMRATNKESPGWEEDLKQYIDALKDYDYVLQNTDYTDEKFTASGEQAIDRWLLNKIAGPEAARMGSLREEECRDAFDKRPHPIGHGRATMIVKNGIQELRKRIVMAFVAAFLLLAPMWLMVLHNTMYTGLATTTACVALFGAFLTYFMDKPMDVLSGTAAYAAVLVVFVGLSNSGE